MSFHLFIRFVDHKKKLSLYSFYSPKNVFISLTIKHLNRQQENVFRSYCQNSGIGNMQTFLRCSMFSFPAMFLFPLSSSHLYLNPFFLSFTHISPLPQIVAFLTHSLTHPASLWSIIQGCFHPLPSSVLCPLGRERCQRSLRPNAHRWMRGFVYPGIFTYLCLIWMFHLSIA